ncbi:MAG: hypothetical protein ACRDP8_20220 [Actinopolymorphaceae bacterium]
MPITTPESGDELGRYRAVRDSISRKSLQLVELSRRIDPATGRPLPDDAPDPAVDLTERLGGDGPEAA